MYRNVVNNILVYGDSNTWGLIPGSSERYPQEIRWTGILQGKERCNNIRILEEGLCGRTTVFEDRLRPGRKGTDALPPLLEKYAPVDAAIIMLGTNDCKTAFKASASMIGNGICQCLNILIAQIPPDRILLVSPIFLGKDVWMPEKDPEFDKDSVLICRQLKSEYKHIAGQYGTAFLAASDFAVASDIDDEHLSPLGHMSLANSIYEKLIEMKVI